MRGLIGNPSVFCRALLIAAVLAPALVVQARAGAHRHAVKAPYSVTVLDWGTGPHDIFVTGLNREGEATGYSVSDGGSSATALIWTNAGVPVTLPFSITSGINASEHVAGALCQAGVDDCAPLLWNDSKAVSLVPGPRQGGSSVNAINDTDEIVGFSFDDSGNVGVLWKGDQAITLPPIAGSVTGAESIARAINRMGPIAGDSTASDGLDHATVWTKEVPHDLGSGVVGGNGANSEADGINDLGWVVGSSGNHSGVTHATLWKGKKATDLGTLTGNESTALAVNNGGQIVGFALSSDFQAHAVIWECGKIIDLQALIAPFDGSTLEKAVAINDRGVILVSTGTPDGLRGYLLTPTRGADAGQCSSN
jgi:probable HAF family extracellular repeat protein